MTDLERQVLEAIGEDIDSPDVFADTDAGMLPIRDSINAAIQELAYLTGVYQRTYHLALLPGQRLYRLGLTGDTFGWVAECWDRARKYRLEQASLLGLSMDDPRWLNRSGYPTQYVHLGEDHLALDRAPTAGGVLELTCALIPKDYTSDKDTVHVKANYERAVVHYAVSEFHASRGSAEHAATEYAQYLDVAGLSDLQQSERTYVQR